MSASLVGSEMCIRDRRAVSSCRRVTTCGCTPCSLWTRGDGIALCSRSCAVWGSAGFVGSSSWTLTSSPASPWTP
eukprot:6925607-Alexandrium_andersonii.AAC.1